MRILIAATLAAVVLWSAGPAKAGDALTDTARAALVAFTEAVIAGPEALAPILAPEYQIMRANGTGYDRDGYLAKGAGTVSIERDFSHEDIVATESDGVMVVRYYLHIHETIDGQPVKQRAPRITVFRMIDGSWKVVAHANFAATS